MNEMSDIGCLNIQISYFNIYLTIYSNDIFLTTTFIILFILPGSNDIYICKQIKYLKNISKIGQESVKSPRKTNTTFWESHLLIITNGTSIILLLN